MSIHHKLITLYYIKFHQHFSVFFCHFLVFQGSVISFEPPSCIEKRDTDSERWIVFSNPTSSYTRVNMSVRFSRDGCLTWSRPLTINPGPSAYSDLTYYKIKDATTGRETVKFACMYECGSLHPYERIAFQTFSLDELCELGNWPPSSAHLDHYIDLWPPMVWCSVYVWPSFSTLDIEDSG